MPIWVIECRFMGKNCNFMHLKWNLQHNKLCKKWRGLDTYFHQQIPDIEVVRYRLCHAPSPLQLSFSPFFPVVIFPSYVLNQSHWWQTHSPSGFMQYVLMKSNSRGNSVLFYFRRDACLSTLIFPAASYLPASTVTAQLVRGRWVALLFDKWFLFQWL